MYNGVSEVIRISAFYSLGRCIIRENVNVYIMINPMGCQKMRTCVPSNYSRRERMRPRRGMTLLLTYLKKTQRIQETRLRTYG